MRRHFTLFGLLLASCTAHAASTLNLSEGVTPLSHDIYQLHMTILWVCVAIGIVVFGAMFYALIYHRKSVGAKPAQFHEHASLEITWTLIPLVILVLLAIPATKVLIHMNNSEKPDVTIKITGYQWKWRYEYLGEGINFFSNISTPQSEIHNQTPKNAHYLREVDKPLVLPIHKKIRFLITSNDVIHAWWVPDLGFQRDAVPGFINEAWAKVNKPGTYYGQCVKLCGINHAYMPIVVQAVTEEQYQNWLLEQKGLKSKSASPLQPGAATTSNLGQTTATPVDLMKLGETTYVNVCAVCHQPDGTGHPPVFPALKGSKIATGPKAAHIGIVMNGKPGTAMQAFKDQLTDEEIAAVITYERNSWGNNMKDQVLPAEIKALRK